MKTETILSLLRPGESFVLHRSDDRFAQITLHLECEARVGPRHRITRRFTPELLAAAAVDVLEIETVKCLEDLRKARDGEP